MQLPCSPHCKQGNGGGGGETAYNKYRVHIAELLGFITDVEGQIDGNL